MGIDWWRNDPMLSTSAQGLAEENRQLRERLEELEEGSGGLVGGRLEWLIAASYLFAVARGLDTQQLGDVSGLRDAALQVLEHRGLQAVTCSVDLAEFGEEALRRNLESLAWLEEVARAHDDVVQAAALRATTAPMRLVTICSDDAGVRARLDEWYDGARRPLSTASRDATSGA